MRGLWGALLLMLIVALPARSQDQATLVADRVAVDGTSVLVAEGGVEITYRGQRITAQALRYDRAADRLAITGPITLADEAGNIILAEQADLKADLTEGILQSARLVLDRKLQIAADQIIRSQGRYTQMTNTVASSCQVCRIDPVPLWEIRAKRVVHDQLERQIYFDQATLRFSGMPLFYVPRLRMPDPTLARATGFMMPRIRTTSGLGPGLKLPYFITLGGQRDVTITPYLSTKAGRTVELRYREAYRSGTWQLDGAMTRDRLLPGETRGYALATGNFQLPLKFKLAFRLETVSDPAYLLDYGLSQKDRLDSRIEATRTRRNEHISARLIRFQSIRAGEDNATIPSLIGDVTFHRRFSGGPFGGEAGLRFQMHSHDRTSTDPADTDGDGHADGRDLRRASLRLDWRRNWVLPMGIVGSVMGEGTADVYSIRQDAVFAGNTTRMDGAAAVELRWPWVGTTGDGATHVIEPVVQLVYNSNTAPALPNEDSALVEFDEGNLFALNRFAGSDARERGGRAHLGLSWTRRDASGWTIGTTLGRVIRADDLGQFGPASGLDGRKSDWLIATELTVPGGLQMTNRLILNDDLSATKAELRMDMNRDRYGLSGSYLWSLADPIENRPLNTSELYLDSRYKLDSNWTGRIAGRYDFVADRATSAAIGLQFRNECLNLDLSLSRRFTSSTSVKPTTDFGLQVDLLGFGSGTEPGPARGCRK